MAQPPLLVNVAEVLHEPGKHRRISAEVDPVLIDAAHPSVGGAVTVDVELASTVDDIVVTGEIVVPWSSQCRRCLRPLDERVRVDVDEHYAEQPMLIERGDAFPIVRGQLDLAALVRDEVLLAAAQERLCRPDCAGLCPTCGRDRNDSPCDCSEATVDARWSVLDRLREMGTDEAGR